MVDKKETELETNKRAELKAYEIHEYQIYSDETNNSSDLVGDQEEKANVSLIAP